MACGLKLTGDVGNARTLLNSDVDDPDKTADGLRLLPVWGAAARKLSVAAGELASGAGSDWFPASAGRVGAVLFTK